MIFATPCRHFAIDPRGPDDDASRGPEVLLEKREFIDNFPRAFAEPLRKIGERSEADWDKESKAVAGARAKIDRATTKAARAKARQELLAIEPAYERRRDLIIPLAEQLKSLSSIASLARQEFENQWPKAARGRDALVVMSPENSLALGCFDLVTLIHARKVLPKITTTPKGPFHAFVTTVANYATANEPDGSELINMRSPTEKQRSKNSRRAAGISSRAPQILHTSWIEIASQRFLPSLGRLTFRPMIDAEVISALTRSREAPMCMKKTPGTLTDSEIRTIGQGGFARIAQEFDARGNPIRRTFFGVNDELVPGLNGVAVEQVSYDEHDRPIVFRPLNSQVADASQVWTRVSYDAAGEVSRIDYVAPDGHVVNGRQNFATVLLEHTDGVQHTIFKNADGETLTVQ